MFSSTCMGSGQRWCSSIDCGTAASMSNSECSGGTNASFCEMPRADSPMQWSMMLCTSDLTLASCSADRSPLDQLHTARMSSRDIHQRQRCGQCGAPSAAHAHTPVHVRGAQPTPERAVALCVARTDLL